ncbi:MAG: aspartate aminotransferase family protein [Cytophagales bacterium]|nr:aspartate aminotransferase family protein [Cytophagales bacterium]
MHLSHTMHFRQYLAHTSPFPMELEIERAEGIYLIAPDGKKYMDMISGIGVSSVGHSHPNIIQAIKNQADKYLHLMVYGEYVLSPQVMLAQKIIQLLGAPFESVYFANSGAEAVEGALKLAKRYTGKTEMVSCMGSYHGSTHGALSVMGNESFKQNFRPLLPGIKHIAYSNIEDFDHINKETACVIIEPIQAEAGVIQAPKSYFKALKSHCQTTGTLIIFDEVQTGFGRTGTMFGYEHTGIVPDIVIFAKGMGGGMPIGAFASSKVLMDSLKTNPILGHITTFGGHPVSCAAALATINVITDLALHKQAQKKGELFEHALKHPKIVQFRYCGLMMAIEFKSFEVLQKIISKCLERGVVTDWFLHNDKCMRLAPPLTITDDEIQEACKKILSAIDET